MRESEINLIKAQIEQMKTSHLFSEAEKKRELMKLEAQLLTLTIPTQL
ncbi:hypothetical protein Q2490_12850 [Myroides odoratimimus]|nr:hypothetical protein [Myroides odoratimimus]MDM1529040.1 hypothetical protein [Myroides odoratimimus]MDM1536400.1 hypothetical protein [Myroides odoratimimus]MDM1676064.1 hypothetical protein [Myroides odoratimimus]MDO5858178.1 hypothetical protein [Myroides odoratimimus]